MGGYSLYCSSTSPKLIKCKRKVTVYLHRSCAFRTLSPQMLCIVINCEECAEIKDKAQSPGYRTNQDNGSLQAQCIGDHTGDDGSERRAPVFNEVLRRLG